MLDRLTPENATLVGYKVPRLPRATDPRPPGGDQRAGTPQAFIDAISTEFTIGCDLAADEHNYKHPFYISTGSLFESWENWIPDGQFGWLNPPFAKITPWVAKCHESLTNHGTRTLLLVPASVDSNWFHSHVFGIAEVRFLKGRIKFDGHKNTFPKPLMLCVYEPGRCPAMFPWDWKARIPR